MNYRITVLLGALLMLQPALAHHSSSPHFDAEKPIVLQGVVTKFRFVNPHAYLYLDVTDEQGVVTSWNCEMGAASPLRRYGWTADLFAPGAEVTINGIMARRDPQGCAFQSGTLADGTHIARNGPVDRSAPAPVEKAVVASNNASIAGNWEPPPRNRGGRERGGPQGRSRPQMTAAGKAALENFDARYDDPALECSPSSIIRVWFETGMVNQIEVLEDKVIIRHEFMDLVRTVHLATQKPADGYEPRLAGYSIGHFEGDDLLIETTGFKAGVLQAHAGGGMLHTDQMHITERLTLSDDALSLTRDYVVTDPAYYSEPLTGSQTWQRSTKALPKYDCVELSGVSKVRPEEA